jgi:hypothetical protein
MTNDMIGVAGVFALTALLLLLRHLILTVGKRGRGLRQRENPESQREGRARLVLAAPGQAGRIYPSE